MIQRLLTSPLSLRKVATCLIGVLITFSVLQPSSSVHAHSLPSTKTYQRIGTISIKKLHVSAIIYVGITDDVFDRGVGQWPGSAQPGQLGNLVVGGHRTAGSRPFFNIDTLRGGDIISISVGVQTFTYVVTGHSIVKPTSMWIIKPTASATLTLFSCHPKGKVTSRYVVRAVLKS